MEPVQTAARAFTAANLGVGLAGFTGPLVQGNDDRVINLKPGLLFGVVAINWVHALAHLGLGVAGLAAAGDARRERNYVKLHAALFTPLAVMGWMHARRHPEERIHMLMGMAVDRRGNFIHSAWAAAAAGVLALDAQGGRNQVPEEDADRLTTADEAHDPSADMATATGPATGQPGARLPVGDELVAVLNLDPSVGPITPKPAQDGAAASR